MGARRPARPHPRPCRDGSARSLAWPGRRRADLPHAGREPGLGWGSSIRGRGPRAIPGAARPLARGDPPERRRRRSHRLWQAVLLRVGDRSAGASAGRAGSDARQCDRARYRRAPLGSRAGQAGREVGANVDRRGGVRVGHLRPRLLDPSRPLLDGVHRLRSRARASAVLAIAGRCTAGPNPPGRTGVGRRGCSAGGAGGLAPAVPPAARPRVVSRPRRRWRRSIDARPIDVRVRRGRRVGRDPLRRRAGARVRQLVSLRWRAARILRSRRLPGRRLPGGGVVAANRGQGQQLVARGRDARGQRVTVPRRLEPALSRRWAHRRSAALLPARAGGSAAPTSRVEVERRASRSWSAW